MSDSPTSLLNLHAFASLQEQDVHGARAVLEAVWERIQASREEGVWIHVLKKDEVRAQVDRVWDLHEGGAELPLLGVPFAVKDNIDVAGPTTAAVLPSAIYKGTAPAVQRLFDAGCILLGRPISTSSGGPAGIAPLWHLSKPL